MASLFISAAHKSSGKTTLSIGLCAALTQQGISLQPFKKGPDYIDPIWLGMAAGRPCYNLDFFTAGKAQTLEDYSLQSQSAELAIIEGNKGLHDGLDLDGSNSNAALAKALGAPVVLVIDARGTMRGIAPLLIGYQQFDRAVNIAGVIANMTGGSRHESKLREAVEHYTDIPFLGAVDQDREIALDEQHLGLIPCNEDAAAADRIRRIADRVNEHIDIEQIIAIAATAAEANPLEVKSPAPRDFSGLRIGIARDEAFGFYYPGDLDAMRASGVEILPIDTLRDDRLVDIDGLFIGGGFPERHATALEANGRLRESIKTAIERGLPAYAECGGLMYMSQKLNWGDESWDMVGVIPAETTMHDKSCGRGYVKLAENSETAPWGLTTQSGELIHAHEFHYSSLDGLPDNSTFAYRMERGNGIVRQRDGLVYKNLLASYSHLRNTRKTPWVERFLTFVAEHKSIDKNPAQALAR